MLESLEKDDMYMIMKNVTLSDSEYAKLIIEFLIKPLGLLGLSMILYNPYSINNSLHI